MSMKAYNGQQWFFLVDLTISVANMVQYAHTFALALHLSIKNGLHELIQYCYSSVDRCDLITIHQAMHKTFMNIPVFMKLY